MIIKLFIVYVVVVLLLLLKELRLISSTRVFFMRPHDICGRSAKRHHLNGLSVCLPRCLSVRLSACLSVCQSVFVNFFYFLPGGRLKIILTKQKKDKWNFSRCFNNLFHTQGSFVVGCVGKLEWRNLRLKFVNFLNVIRRILSVWTEPKRCWVVRKTSWMNLLLILFAIKHWKLSES